MVPSRDVLRLPPWHPVVLRRVWSRHRAAGALATVAAVTATALTLQASMAALTVNASTGDNSWRSGRVALTYEGSGTAVFSVTDMLPGDSVTRCVRVDYTGDLDAEVRLYLSGTSGAGSLADHLQLAVDTGSGSDPGCGDFSVDAPQLPVTGLLTAGTTHAGHAAGIGTWRPTGPAARTYRITVTLPADTPSSAQGRTASTTFVWEARSV